MEEIKSRVKKLTVTQICVLGVGGIWFFLTILLLLFCLYANRQSRLETEEGGRMAMGHWDNTETGGGIEVRRVSEPYTRRIIPQPGMTVQLGLKGSNVGVGVRKPDVAHHGVMQRGPVGPTRDQGKRVRDKSVERDKRKDEIRVKEAARGKDRRKMERSKGSSGKPPRR